MSEPLENGTDLRQKIKADVDFDCIEADCGRLLQFNLMDAAGADFELACPDCRRAYQFDSALREKLRKLRDMILAIREAESILGDCTVGVTVPGGTVKIPYALLLTRLNTILSLNIGDRKVDFHFRVEPSSPDTFR